MRALALALIFAGCGGDVAAFEIQWILERGDAQTCPSDDCANIPMGCDARVLIRIVDADDEKLVYARQCLFAEGGGDLCALSDIRPDPEEIPNTMVKIQVGVWPASVLGDADCPDVEFDYQNQVSTSSPQPRPALAGQTYFAAGSSEVAALTLGCVNVDAMTTACQADDTVDVNVQVLTFETRQSVAPQLGPRLSVGVGEPRFSAQVGRYVLTNDDMIGLERSLVVPPVWQADDLALSLDSSVCIHVLDGGTFQATGTLHCEAVDGDEEALALEGILVDADLIDVVEEAVGEIPAAGLVLGVVIDEDNDPVAGVEVTGTNGAVVQYLSDDMTILPGATATSSSGLFVSTSAPYATAAGVTRWTAELGELRELTPGIGGQVEAKVTVVLLTIEDGVITP